MAADVTFTMSPHELQQVHPHVIVYRQIPTESKHALGHSPYIPKMPYADTLVLVRHRGVCMEINHAYLDSHRHLPVVAVHPNGMEERAFGLMIEYVDNPPMAAKLKIQYDEEASV